MNKPDKWFIAASVINLPMLIMACVTPVTVVLKLYYDACPRPLWFIGMFGMIGLPTPIGIGIACAGLLLAIIALLMPRQRTSSRKSLLIAYLIASALCLAYGLWFNITGQGDSMF
jgi:hypothetical protein